MHAKTGEATEDKKHWNAYTTNNIYMNTDKFHNCQPIECFILIIELIID